MVTPRKIVYAVVESIVLGERVKPVQEAVRRTFYRFKLDDETIYNRFSGLVYNVFKNHGLVDYIVEEIIGFNLRRTDPITRSILRVAGYVFQLDPIIDNKWKHRFYKYLVDYAKKKLGPHAKRVVEAIELLKRETWSPSNSDEELMLKYRIHPKLLELIKDSLEELGEDVEEFLKATLKPPPHSFRVNALKATPKAILNYLRNMGYHVEPGRYSRWAVRLYGSMGREVLKLVETGVLTPQDEASMVAVEILPLHPNMVVADLCAAPGNKTSYLAETTSLNVEIHAFDVNRDRIKRMYRLLERTGTRRVVHVYHMNGRKAVEVLGHGRVDLVLVDPPCSSTGALARNPDVRWRYTPKALSKINELQKELLATATELVKRGGYVLYTTCSVLISEGEYVVKHVLDNYDVEIVPLDKPFKESPVLEGVMRSYPHLHNVTGFFYALLRRV